ncbi:MAG: nitrous oxide reductase family maturation protein NosD [Thermoflavifilum sp.]|nr:nitrous oxide reductase family maturation protein NosD [Thermoflavifilum sp.]
MIRLFVIVSICFIYVINQPVHAKQIVVCNTCQAHDLGEALRLAHSFDTLLLKGTFKIDSPIIINKPIYIIGEQAVLDAQNKTAIFLIEASHVYLSHLTLQNTGMSYTEDRSAISLMNAQDVHIYHIHFINVYFGIYARRSTDIHIAFNEFYTKSHKENNEFNTGDGIHLWYCKRVDVYQNKIQHQRDGIYLEFTTNSVIRQNVSENNIRYGMHFMFSNHDQYIQNTFSHNGAGVAVMYSSYIEMKGNNFIDNNGPNAYGLLLKEIHDSEILQNKIAYSSTGVFMEECTRINLVHNQFLSNGWAFKLTGSSTSNYISKNDFMHNAFDVALLSDQNNQNVFIQNYWSDYRGYDLNKDGIGDIPFHPMNFFAYVVMKYDISVLLLRSLLESVLNLAESVMPMITPVRLIDPQPLMKPLNK